MDSSSTSSSVKANVSFSSDEPTNLNVLGESISPSDATQGKCMKVKPTAANTIAEDINCTPFGELHEGVTCKVKVMVCRKWDVTSIHGKYLSTDYLLSDHMGNAIHCIARSSIAHCFASKLREGSTYYLSAFTLKANKDTYRLRDRDNYIIQLEGDTIVENADCDVSTFTRYPMSLIPLEDIVLNGNSFLIDVLGCPTNVGKVKPTKTGSKYVDCQLVNESGTRIRVTLWGPLCDDLVKKHVRCTTSPFVVVFPAMNIREYRGELYLSSTSATTIYDSVEIPEVVALKNLMSAGGPAPQALPPREANLLQILAVAREHKAARNRQSTTFTCKVRISSIRPKNSWYYVSCNAVNCKKSLKPIGGRFWCESCNKDCEFPQTRYRLNADVTDDTTTLVVTMFDDMVENLVKKRASKMLDEDNAALGVLPQELISLTNTHLLLELKTHTYYDHGEYESFTASNVIKVSSPPEVQPHDASTTTAAKDIESKEAPSVDNEILSTDEPGDTNKRRKLDGASTDEE